jgi:hypothetical protein
MTPLLEFNLKHLGKSISLHPYDAAHYLKFQVVSGWQAGRQMNGLLGE